MEITGTWQLKSFLVESPNGQMCHWGKNAHGQLMYSSGGHVSVAINRELDEKATNKPDDILNSILFYSGTYKVNGNSILHMVTQASDPSRIGKKLIRFAKLRSDILELATPPEDFGKATLIWRRVK